MLRHRSLILPDMSEFPGPCAGECSGRRAFLRDAVVAAAALAGLTTMAAWTPLVAQSVQANGTIRYPIPVADSISIDGENEVILCRSKGEVFAFALSCPHQNTALRALPKNAGFQCPRHKSKYQPNGTFINGKATRVQLLGCSNLSSANLALQASGFTYSVRTSAPRRSTSLWDTKPRASTCSSTCQHRDA